MLSINFQLHFDHYEEVVQDEVVLEKKKKEEENKMELEKE